MPQQLTPSKTYLRSEYRHDVSAMYEAVCNDLTANNRNLWAAAKEDRSGDFEAREDVQLIRGHMKDQAEHQARLVGLLGGFAS